MLLITLSMSFSITPAALALMPMYAFPLSEEPHFLKSFEGEAGSLFQARPGTQRVRGALPRQCAKLLVK